MDRLLILGASGRAAAASARRAGFAPVVVDLFADADTRRIAECLRCPVEEYPQGLFRLAEHVPRMPWIYTGGLENYPLLIAQLATERPLWGNGPQALRLVRDPFALAEALAIKGIKFAEPRRCGERLPADRRWLRKPLRGSAGFGIRFMEPDEELATSADDYVQEFIPGPSYGAVFAGREHQSTLLGITSQLIGTPWLHAAPFRYAGSIGPVEIDDPQDVIRAGFRLANRYSMWGLNGFDFIQTDDRSVIVEMNPRYTASVEVLEYATGMHAIDWHCRMWRHPSYIPDAFKPANSVVGKAVYYAPHRLTIPVSGPWDASLATAADVSRMPIYADIPHPGDVIEAGQPVLTFFAQEMSVASCTKRLQSRAAELDVLFGTQQ